MFENETEMKPQKRLIDLNELRLRVPYSRSSIYRLVREGKFPSPVRLGENRIAFDADSIEEWIDAKLAGKPWPDTDKEASDG